MKKPTLFSLPLLIALLLSLQLPAFAEEIVENKTGNSPETAVAERAPSAFDQLLNQANELIGVPYRNGGASPATGFDCSGLVGYLFKSNLGLNLPRSSKDMSQAGEKIDKDNLQPGDLLFFKMAKKGISHVGIYMGDGLFIHAPWLGSSVGIAHLGYKFWDKRFVMAKRVQPKDEPAVQSITPQQPPK